jgi:hypothetical protein
MAVVEITTKSDLRHIHCTMACKPEAGRLDHQRL